MDPKDEVKAEWDMIIENVKKEVEERTRELDVEIPRLQIESLNLHQAWRQARSKEDQSKAWTKYQSCLDQVALLKKEQHELPGRVFKWQGWKAMGMSPDITFGLMRAIASSR